MLAICQRQRHYTPYSIGTVRVKIIRACSKQVAIRHTCHTPNVTIICAGWQTCIEVFENLCRRICNPYTAVSVEQHTVMPLDSAAQQPAIPVSIFVALGQYAATDIQSRKQRRMIQHDTRQAKHHNKKTKHQPKNLMMFAPSFSFQFFTYI